MLSPQTHPHIKFPVKWQVAILSSYRIGCGFENRSLISWQIPVSFLNRCSKMINPTFRYVTLDKHFCWEAKLQNLSSRNQPNYVIVATQFCVIPEEVQTPQHGHKSCKIPVWIYQNILHISNYLNQLSCPKYWGKAFFRNFETNLLCVDQHNMIYKNIF